MHAGSLAPTVQQWFFDPVNQQWLDASATFLSADQALADAFAAGAGDADMLAAQWGILTADLGLLGAAFSSVPIVIVGELLGA